jgi:hypothetical protein
MQIEMITQKERSVWSLEYAQAVTLCVYDLVIILF